jgi:Glycosyl transferase family 2/2-phospho-L-lactate transferase CofD
VARDVLLNITRGENLFLVAQKENGAVLLNEADIVAAQDDARISELFLIDEDTYVGRIEKAAAAPPGGWSAVVSAAHRIPRLDPEAAVAIAAADVIIYGPGTQHSSLLPSYMTEGVAEAIAANTGADKVFIGNIHRDFDIQTDDANDLAQKLVTAMSRKGRTQVDWLKIVSHFFVQDTAETGADNAKYVPFDRSRFAFPIETVQIRNWEEREGRHSGGYVLDELRHIVQSRIDIELAQVHHLVSIVIPVLNEAATIESVLKSVTALDFQDLGLNKEVIVVDGGSSDGTLEQARSVRNAKLFALPDGESGRGAALRLGISKARGNLIVFFPGDGEYRPDDIHEVVRTLVRPGFRAVFGTRAVKCTDLSQSLKEIYGDNRKLYLTSKYGGILLSVVTLLLYNRYVSDVLSSLKGFDARLLQSLSLESSGIDLETEIVSKLSHRREYMFELPVEYRPRTRRQGKKIRTNDGLKALAALFRFRWRRS